ncbi:MAG: SAM-dependent methyltransferase [Actinobacteria bacterium]|nr:SAM-dependent methyltransferase [Actinomycetota bacterium]
MSALEGVLLERIRRNGPMPFAAFMSTALYHPRLGYYAADLPRSSRGGDFVTSPELDPAFAGLWVDGFRQTWEECGRPGMFGVLEVGPGEGAFAAGVLASATGAFADALELHLVERLPVLEARQRMLLSRYDNVSWSPSLRETPVAPDGCVFANEILDNLPVHLVERRGGRLMEVCVGAIDGRLAFVLLPPASPELERYLDRSDLDLAEGHRAEVGLAAESFTRQAAARIGRGAIFLIDYGFESDDLSRRVDGSLVSYSSSGADDRVLERPGAKDITAHVNWTAVRAAGEGTGLRMLGLRPQREVLGALGLWSLDDGLRRMHRSAAAEGRGAEAVSAMSRRGALGALADPGGLGALGVMAGLKGIGPPPFLLRA